MRIKELTAGASIVNQPYLVNEVELRPFRGKPGYYLRLVLLDQTGQIEARVWDDAEVAYANLRPGSVALVAGRVERFNGELQLQATSIADGDMYYDPSGFLPSIENYDIIKQQFMRRLAEVKSWANPFLKLLVDEIFEGEFLEAFCRAPAAKYYHHAVVGGLMLHTLDVSENAESLASLYDGVDVELTVVGALLHDIGKVDEISCDADFTYTVQGTMLGHIVLGILKIRDAVNHIRARGSEFPVETEMLLMHILASHHGVLENGSAKRPKITEAAIVHHADMADCVVDQFSRAAGDAGSTSYSAALKRQVYHCIADTPAIVPAEDDEDDDIPY